MEKIAKQFFHSIGDWVASSPSTFLLSACGREELGNIGGFKLLTSSSSDRGPPIRLQNFLKSHGCVATNYSGCLQSVHVLHVYKISICFQVHSRISVSLQGCHQFVLQDVIIIEQLKCHDCAPLMFDTCPVTAA